jgi:hypothetical protein
MRFELVCPGGQVTILAEQVGGGLTQLKFVLAGIEVRLIFVTTPVQIVLGEGELTTGTGFIIIDNEAVGPAARQFELVP